MAACAQAFVRVVFPLTALLLLVVARFAFRHYGSRPVFIDIAMPLLLALAAIRMVVYAMRKLFVSQAWLKTGERAIAFSIWGVADPLFHRCAARSRRRTGRDSHTGRPLGGVAAVAGEAAMLAVILTLVVTLWLSGLIELRLLKATSFDTNTKAVLAKFVRAVLLIVGVLVALQAIGFDLTLPHRFRRCAGRRHRPRAAKARCQLHCRLHDPARSLDTLGRPHHRRRPARCRVARHVPLRGRDQPGRRRGHRAQRDADHHHGAQPFLFDAGSPEPASPSRSPTTATSTSRSS
jgi:hypothetical protein